MADPLVSICIPSYNSSSYLPSLFNSLLAQTYENIEIIFIDDASLDDSFAIAKSFAPMLEQKFTSVKILENEQNLGAVLSLDKAFSMISGELISYLDADDYYTENKIAKNVNYFAEHPEMGAVHSNYFAIHDGFRIVSDYNLKSFGINFIPQGWVFEELLTMNFICACTMMVRREIFERSYTFKAFHRRNYRMGDYPAYLQLSRIAQIGYDPTPLAYYRVLRQSMSHTQSHAERTALNKAIARVQQHARLGILQPLPPQNSAPDAHLHQNNNLPAQTKPGKIARLPS